MDVWLLDVGQGSCVVVDCPDRDRPLLVDCGSTARSDRNDRDETVSWISARLAQWGAPTVLISHGDLDHYSLVPDAIAPTETDGVWLGGARADYGAPLNAWIANVENAGGTVSTLPNQFFGPADSDLHCGAAVSDILIANASLGASKNADSVVLALTYADVTVVLAGDAEGDTTEAQALANRATLERLSETRAIVVGSHHGARTHDSNSEAWAAAWAPYALVFSQRPSSFGHPACDVVQRYEGHMENAVASHRVNCDRTGSTLVTNRILTTSGRGDILIRIRPTRLEIFCQQPSAACSGPPPDAPVS